MMVIVKRCPDPRTHGSVLSCGERGAPRIRRTEVADLTEAWKTLREEIDGRSRRMSSDVGDALGHVQSLAHDLGERLQTEGPAGTGTVSIESLDSLFGGPARRLLFEPIALLKKVRPLWRILSAIRTAHAERYHGASQNGVPSQGHVGRVDPGQWRRTSVTLLAAPEPAELA